MANIKVESFTNPITQEVLQNKDFSFANGGNGGIGGNIDLSPINNRLDTIITLMGLLPTQYIEYQGSKSDNQTFIFEYNRKLLITCPNAWAEVMVNVNPYSVCNFKIVNNIIITNLNNNQSITYTREFYGSYPNSQNELPLYDKSKIIDIPFEVIPNNPDNMISIEKEVPHRININSEVVIISGGSLVGSNLSLLNKCYLFGI